MFRALRHHNFRLLIAGTSLVGLVQPLLFVTQIFWVQDVYPERQSSTRACSPVADYESRGGVERERSVLGAFADGLAYTRHVVILGAVALVFVMNAVGMPAVANLGVIWMTEILNVSRAGFAVVALGGGGGAVAGSIFFARRPQLAGRGTTRGLATLVFAICTVVLARSRFIPLMALVNVGLGFSLAASSVSAAMIIQQEVSDEMRGRVMGLFPLTNGIAMLISMPISGVARGLGLPIVPAVLGWTTPALAAAIVLRLPAVRRVRPRPAGEYAAAAGGG